MSRVLGIGSISHSTVRRGLESLGYKSSKSIFNPKVILTDAPVKAVYDVIRAIIIYKDLPIS